MIAGRSPCLGRRKNAELKVTVADLADLAPARVGAREPVQTEQRED